MRDMTGKAHEAAPPPPNPPPGAAQSEERLRKLIRDAFEAARRTGRTDWQQMTTAVLKNRLLSLTGRAFKESDYGAQTISELVRLLPDLLLFDQSTSPPTVRLLPSQMPVDPPVVAEGTRIRRDLWNAVVDYRAPGRYVWDSAQAPT